jgi:2-oxoglutaroyl-CoA hydrolase
MRGLIERKELTMASPYTFADPRLAKLDGFQVEIDEAHERADIILNRPPLNVVSMPERDQLRLVFETLDEDARVRVIVVRSIGEHFSSGGNIGGFMEATPEKVSKLAWNIASPARCSKLGQIPGSGGSARLQKMIGITRTKDIVMRSKRVTAKQAFDWGVVTECVPDAELEKATDKLVDELRTFSPLAQRTAKKLLNDSEDSTLSIAIELEGHCYSRLRQSDDFKEGVEAFNAKRPAKFIGS